MDWNANPGEALSSAERQPSEAAVAVLAELIAETKLRLKSFERDRSLSIWRALDASVDSGRLSRAEVDVLRRDPDGAFSIPLARKYIAAGNAEGVTRWMRDQAAFWNYNWIDRNVRGGNGQGTLRMFEMLRTEGAASVGADLAAAHVAGRFSGVRYHWGLRGELKEFAKIGEAAVRRDNVLAVHSKFSRPHRIEVVFDWMDYIITKFRPFVEAGDLAARERLQGIEQKLAKERAAFEREIGEPIWKINARP